jgi:hypothetical protein
MCSLALLHSRAPALTAFRVRSRSVCRADSASRGFFTADTVGPAADEGSPLRRDPLCRDRRSRHVGCHGMRDQRQGSESVLSCRAVRMPRSQLLPWRVRPAVGRKARRTGCAVGAGNGGVERNHGRAAGCKPHPHPVVDGDRPGTAGRSWISGRKTPAPRVGPVTVPTPPWPARCGRPRSGCRVGQAAQQLSRRGRIEHGRGGLYAVEAQRQQRRIA